VKFLHRHPPLLELRPASRKIDRLVDKLYGLTDKEIRIVEGKRDG